MRAERGAWGQMSEMRERTACAGRSLFFSSCSSFRVPARKVKPRERRLDLQNSENIHSGDALLVLHGSLWRTTRYKGPPRPAPYLLLVPPAPSSNGPEGGAWPPFDACRPCTGHIRKSVAFGGNVRTGPGREAQGRTERFLWIIILTLLAAPFIMRLCLLPSYFSGVCRSRRVPEERPCTPTSCWPCCACCFRAVSEGRVSRGTYRIPKGSSPRTPYRPLLPAPCGMTCASTAIPRTPA